MVRYSQWNISEPPDGADLDSFENILTVTSANWEAVVEATANANGQLLFTTFYGNDFDIDYFMQMTTNFYAWLHAAQLSNNILFLSESNYTCKALWKFGLPCWYDEFCPRGEALPPGTDQHAPHVKECLQLMLL